MQSRALTLLMSIGMAGCTYLFEPSYDMTFRCGERGGSDCPLDKTCPELPLGAGGCDDIPSLFEQPAIPATVGRPVGCVARLPYGNPYYDYNQQFCICGGLVTPDDGGHKDRWTCPL